MAEGHRCPECDAELPDDAPGGLCPVCLLQQGMDAATQSPDLAPTQEGGPADAWFQAPEADYLAKYFPQLEILELLGQGGMGAVYKARQPKLNRVVALKVLPPKFSGDRNFADRFVREAQALAKLNHPNIVTVYDFGETNGLYYFLMEFVDGVNLRQALAAGSLSPGEALAIVPQVCDALQFAHDEGVVHRDIKPENVLLDGKGRVKIADFGLAKLFGSPADERRLTVSHQAMGTMHYMAPEQMENPLAVDHRADIYSLGVVLYELLTGELPLGRFDLPSHKAAVNSELDEVVLRTLQKEPGRRYQHVSEFKTAMQKASDADAAVPPQQVVDRSPLAPGKSPDGEEITATAPNYGQILMGSAMLVQGLAFLGFTSFSVGNVFFWIGMGLVLGGGGSLSAAWQDEQRLLRPFRFDPGDAIRGGVMMGLGAVIFCFTFAQYGVNPGNALIWIGMGLFLGGAGTARGAWASAEKIAPEVDEQAGAAPVKPAPGKPAAWSAGQLDAARDRLHLPAVGLILVGLLGLWPNIPLLISLGFPSISEFIGDEIAAGELVAASALGLVAAALLITAGVSMLGAKRRGLVLAGGVLALLPCHPAFCVGLPIGIWTLLVMAKPEVKAVFAATRADADRFSD